MKYYIGKVPFGKDDNDSLAHYGRKGMKWGKNIFEDEPNQVFKAAGRAAKNVASGAARAVGNATRGVSNWYNGVSGSAGPNQPLPNRIGRQVGKTATNVGNAVGQAKRSFVNWADNTSHDIGDFVDRNITGNSARDEAERQRRKSEIYKKTYQNADKVSKAVLERVNEGLNNGSMSYPEAYELSNRVDKIMDYRNQKMRQSGDARIKSNAAKREADRSLFGQIGKVGNAVGGAAKQVYDKTDQLGNRIGINNLGKLMYDPVYAAKQAGNAVGNIANNVGNAVGGAANAAGNWVGDRARDVDRFVNTSITGKNFHDQADRLRSSGNQEAVNVANQLDEIGNRSLLGQAGNLVNNIGNAVGDARQWVGDRVNEANRFINTSITGKNFHDQANQIRANSNHPEAANVADQLDEIGNRSLFGRIGNAVGQAGQWLGERANDVGSAVGGAANAAGGWVGDRVRDINDLAGQAGQAVGNVANGAGQWLGERARDVGNFVDQNITGNSAREEAGKHYGYANRHDEAATEHNNRYKDLILEAYAAQGPERDDLLDQADQAHYNNMMSEYNRIQEERLADAAKRRADNTLFGQVGNAVGQAGQAVGQTMSNIGDWGGEQLDRGKRILDRLFGRR